jgi:hypothetical protein
MSKNVCGCFPSALIYENTFRFHFIPLKKGNFSGHLLLFLPSMKRGNCLSINVTEKAEVMGVKESVDFSRE